LDTCWRLWTATGFNLGQVPNPRTQRYTDPKALHHRRRSEPDWGMLSGLVLARPMEAAGNDAFPAGRATEEALVSLHSGEAYAHRRDGPRPTTGGWCAISPGAAAYRGAPTLAGDSGTLRDRRVISRGRAVGCCTGPRSPRSRPDRPSFYQRLRTTMTIRPKSRSPRPWASSPTPSCATAGQAPGRFDLSTRKGIGGKSHSRADGLHLGVRHGSSSRGRRRLQRAGYA